MIGVSINVWSVAKDTIQFLKRKRKKKIPVGQFIKMVEKNYTIKLSKGSKIKLIESLYGEGLIDILTSRNGKKYIVLGRIRV